MISVIINPFSSDLYCRCPSLTAFLAFNPMKEPIPGIPLDVHSQSTDQQIAHLQSLAPSGQQGGAYMDARNVFFHGTLPPNSEQRASDAPSDYLIGSQKKYFFKTK